MEQSNYKVQLQSMGIREFDEVFMRFNNLINRLRHEEKLRKDLVSDTSHELNTPLTTMIGQLTAMQEGKFPLTRERVAILKEQAERLAELVQQLDAYTKARMPNAGEPEDIYLRQFCEELINHFSLDLKQKGITAKLHIAEDYIIHVNSGALQHILMNLMQNTLRYSQATEITIEATAHEFMFSDNGKGVPSESLPYLFERFYRVDKSRNRATGGLGLGLAIVRELAESQGLAITAVAGHPGLTLVLKINA
ncbi:sensor histidine kinase [Ktedonosporobacter rubrisoli]|uniref:sensor histidine kinase n=1 Tax=Ktedonosporobacter rubrisoli TaxID=2509675 RepID=UPI001F5D96A7|nr:HAMP domain-containing sensor histidine kinase [Ktedonosporobacter rubrisoli]